MSVHQIHPEVEVLEANPPAMQPEGEVVAGNTPIMQPNVEVMAPNSAVMQPEVEVVAGNSPMMQSEVKDVTANSPAMKPNVPQKKVKSQPVTAEEEDDGVSRDWWERVNPYTYLEDEEKTRKRRAEQRRWKFPYIYDILKWMFPRPPKVENYTREDAEFLTSILGEKFEVFLTSPSQITVWVHMKNDLDKAEGIKKYFAQKCVAAIVQQGEMVKQYL